MSNAAANIEAIRTIRGKMLSGELTYDQAKAEAQPIIDSINEKTKEIAKKHNRKASKVSFAAIMR